MAAELVVRLKLEREGMWLRKVCLVLAVATIAAVGAYSVCWVVDSGSIPGAQRSNDSGILSLLSTEPPPHFSRLLREFCSADGMFQFFFFELESRKGVIEIDSPIALRIPMNEIRWSGRAIDGEERCGVRLLLFPLENSGGKDLYRVLAEVTEASPMVGGPVGYWRGELRVSSP